MVAFLKKILVTFTSYVFGVLGNNQNNINKNTNKLVVLNYHFSDIIFFLNCQFMCSFFGGGVETNCSLQFL